MDTEKKVLKRTYADVNLPPVPSPPTKKHRKNHQYYEIFGDSAKLSISIRRQRFNQRKDKSLYPQDFHQFILWLLGDKICCPPWILTKHHPLCERLVIIQIDYLNVELIQELRKYHQKQYSSFEFPFFQSNDYCPLLLDIPKFPEEMKSNGNHKYSHFPSFKKLTVVNIQKINGLKKIIDEFNKQKAQQCNSNNAINHSLSILEQSAEENNVCLKECEKRSIFGDTYKYPPEFFIHSLTKLKLNGYPLKSRTNKQFNHFLMFDKCLSSVRKELTEDTVDIVTNLNSESVDCENSSAESVSIQTKDVQRMVAIDCEMVLTSEGIELARISIISENGNLLYDSLVKPLNPITDYCTKFSGITAAMLTPITKHLSEVQIDICQFIDNKTIICGHGLENDLRALHMIHCNILDTSLLYFNNSYKPKLRNIAYKFLKRNIQQSGNGHNSCEDALAALDLVKLKLRYGPKYGKSPPIFSSLFTILNHFNRKSCLYGPVELFAPISNSTAVSMVRCIDDEKTFIKALPKICCNDESVIKMDLIWMYITNIDRCGKSMNGMVDEKITGRLYQHLMDVYDGALNGSVILLVTGKKDIRILVELRLKLVQAIKTGNRFQAQVITQQIRTFDSDSKQYPIWIATINK